MKLFVEIWCSPSRFEIYDKNVMYHGIGYDYTEDDLQMYLDMDFFIDVFGDEYLTMGGLWKVIFEMEVVYTRGDGWSTDNDIEFYMADNPYFEKLKNFGELKDRWLALTGRTESYYGKPWRKDHDSFQFS